MDWVPIVIVIHDDIVANILEPVNDFYEQYVVISIISRIRMIKK